MLLRRIVSLREPVSRARGYPTPTPRDGPLESADPRLSKRLAYRYLRSPKPVDFQRPNGYIERYAPLEAQTTSNPPSEPRIIYRF